MPFGISPLVSLSYFQRWVVVVCLLVLLQWMKPEAGAAATVPSIKLSLGASDREDLVDFVPLLGHRGGGNEEELRSAVFPFRSAAQQGQVELNLLGPVAASLKEDLQAGVEFAFGFGAHQQRRFRSHAAQCCGRRAVFPGSDAARSVGRLAVFPQLLLLVERRPFLFLPAGVPKGRQRLFGVSSMECHGDIVAPSGFVPGGGDVLLAWEWSWTQLQFPSSCWGPLCIRQGPSCNFLVSFGLFATCTFSILI